MNNDDNKKRFGMKLKDAYMKEAVGTQMSRDEFHRLIKTAEKKKNNRKRVLMGTAVACVALCLIFGGFVAGISMRESASAGRSDESKTVQQGDSVVIGSGASENGQNVGASTETYTDLEDVPEDIRKDIHFLDSDEFELEKVKVVRNEKFTSIVVTYKVEDNEIVITEDFYIDEKELNAVINAKGNKYEYQGETIYEQHCGEYLYLSIHYDSRMLNISIPQCIETKKEAVLSDLFGIESD